MNRKDLVESLTKWIDAGVIAESIVYRMEQDKKALCFEDAKAIWLDCLENELPTAIGTACTYAQLADHGR